MAEEKKTELLLYIDSNKWYFYTANTGSTLELAFTPDVISDQDIINKEKLDQIVDLFIQNNLRGFGFDVIIVFSHNTAFEKDLPPGISEETESKIQAFTDVVPFEEVLSKTYKLSKKIKVIAVNKTIFDAIKQALEKNRSTILMALPLSILQEVNPDLVNQMDLSGIVAKADSFKQYNLVESTYSPTVPQEKKDVNKKDNKRLYILIGVFVFLLLILAAVAYTTLFSKPTPKATPVVQSAPPPAVQTQNSSSASPSAITPQQSGNSIVPVVP